MNYLKWIWFFWRPHRKWVWILAILTLTSSAAMLLLPYFLGVAINTSKQIMGEVNEKEANYPGFVQGIITSLNNWIGVPDPENIGETTKKVVTLLLFVGLMGALSEFYPRVRMLINNLLGMDIREYYFARIIEKGYRFFNKFRTGDLVTRLTDDVDAMRKISWFVCSGIFRALESICQFTLSIAFMFILNWKLALISIAPFPIMLYIFYRVRRQFTEVSFQRQGMVSTTNDALEAAYSGIRIVKAFNSEDGLSGAFRNVLSDRFRTEMNFQRIHYKVHFLYDVINTAGQLVVIAAGGYMVINDTLSLGDFYAFYVYLSLLLGPLTDIPQLFVSSRVAFASIDREVEIENTPGGTEKTYTGTVPVSEYQSIKVENAAFSYSDDDVPLLDGINMEIGRGQKVAVIGTVGSGKSTLLKMVAGLYPPLSGHVKLNGHPISHFKIDEYRSIIGYIPQEATLFSESVRDNVRFGRDIPDEKILESLEQAQVRSEVQAMPNGLDEMLGQRGLTVSGGQKQRLAIARALAGNPRLLLMDDCTASLDAENEQQFWATLRRQYPDTACLIVTHRLATAHQADVIYVLDRGRIVGKGTHDELLDSCEAYRNFLSMDELRAALNSKNKH